MFGSKLRSWMENHIVRPRKKGNKNKNGNSASGATSTAGSGHEAYKKPASSGFLIHHGTGAATTAIASSVPASSSVSSGSANHHNSNSNGNGGGGCSSAVSSPVRRREVSPIQNHTQSRYGWQSPDQETVTSPKSDNFLYAPQHHRVRATHHHSHTAPPSKESSTDDRSIAQPQQRQQQQQQHPADCSSSSISSLSWSTGSKEPSMHSAGNNPHAKLLPVSLGIHSSSPPASTRNAVFRDLQDEDGSTVHYEEIRTLLRHPGSITSNNNNILEHERPKSEQLSSFAPARSYQDNGRSQDDASTRYGRLLPSKMPPPTSEAPFMDRHNGYDLRSGSAECIVSNNNQRVACAYSAGVGVCVGVASYANSMHSSTSQMAHTHRQAGRFRAAGRCGGSQALGAGTPTALTAAPLHSLSSPESAYSTGYSTDGTSPGAIYIPPEYYINMRTGTHYFPKSVNSLAIEAQRYKFGLNKIEEMSPIDPLPKTTFGNVAGGHHSHGHGHAKMSHYAVSVHAEAEQQQQQLEQSEQLPPAHAQTLAVGCHSPLSIRSTIVLPTLKGFESPSPRQRCRIRTNPWYSTTETSSSGATIAPMQAFMPPVSASSTISSSMSSTCSSAMKMEIDAASTSSSGIKSSNGKEGDTAEHVGEGIISDNKQLYNGITSYESSESSSSLTEVENMKRTYSPNTIKRKRSELLHRSTEQPVADMLVYTAGGNGNVGCAIYPELAMSDDDATLNEMMGKFDESYVYEKETDILSSDSDLTDCPSDLDTGQDAGDECDTDELLDIDFIDTSSMQEVYDRKDFTFNLGNCYYYNNNSSPMHLSRTQIEARDGGATGRSRKNSRSLKATKDSAPGSASSQRRRKRFLKTRKKSSETREQFCHNSPVHRRARESRSVGGTPVSLRRQYAAEKKRIYKTSPLSNRSSSLVLMDVREQRFMAIAESERALLKADLEADVKYRQLILEAESLLVSMKSSMQSLPRETPVASPRRVNPLANKRVEMLKNCEAEPKRDPTKQQQQQQQSQQQHQQMQQERSFDGVSHAEQELAAAIHKRIELLKYKTTSAPNSPKFSRCSPRKTHLTNFINQNNPPEVPLRKSATQERPIRPQSPQLQLNGRRMRSSPVASPSSRRRFRSHSPKLTPAASAVIDSDSDDELGGYSFYRPASRESTRNIHLKRSAEDMANCNYLPEIARIMLYEDADVKNCNLEGALGSYCPQSEPLKRKVYKGSSTFERIKKSFDMESELPKQAMLAKIHLLRRERQSSTAKLSSPKSSSHELNQQHSYASIHKLSAEPVDDEPSSGSSKKQLILNTIADLKRSLENQSVELNGLNEED